MREKIAMQPQNPAPTSTTTRRSGQRTGGQDRSTREEHEKSRPRGAGKSTAASEASSTRASDNPNLTPQTSDHDSDPELLQDPRQSESSITGRRTEAGEDAPGPNPAVPDPQGPYEQPDPKEPRPHMGEREREPTQQAPASRRDPAQEQLLGEQNSKRQARSSGCTQCAECAECAECRQAAETEQRSHVQRGAREQLTSSRSGGGQTGKQQFTSGDFPPLPPRGQGIEHAPGVFAANLPSAGGSKNHTSVMDRISSLIPGGKKTIEDQLRDEKVKLRREVKELKEQLGSAGNMIGGWKQRCNQIEAHSAEQAKMMGRTNRRIIEENEKLQREMREYEQRFENLAKVVENKQLYLGPQQSDEAIAKIFESLVHRVKSFTTYYYTDHEVPLNSLDGPESEDEAVKGLQMALASIVPGSERSYREFLHVKKTRRLVAQAMIGSMLCSRVLGGSNLWTYYNAESIETLEFTLWAGKPEINLRDFNDWRAFTVSLISRAEKNIPKAAAAAEDHSGKTSVDMAANIISATWEWAKPNSVPNHLQEQLSGIIRDAIGFSLLLRTQRAMWSVRLPLAAEAGQSLEFNAETMQDIDTRGGDDDEMEISKVVSLIVFPGLFKRGDTNGEHYDTETCVVKSMVKCYSYESER